MTTKKKAIWILAGTAVAGTGFWLWWRQKDAVPASAIPILQQARAVLAINQPSTGNPAPPPAPSTTDTLLSSIIPGYIPLPPQTP